MKAFLQKLDKFEKGQHQTQKRHHAVNIFGIGRVTTFSIAEDSKVLNISSIYY